MRFAVLRWYLNEYIFQILVLMFEYCSSNATKLKVLHKPVIYLTNKSIYRNISYDECNILGYFDQQACKAFCYCGAAQFEMVFIIWDEYIRTWISSWTKGIQNSVNWLYFKLHFTSVIFRHSVDRYKIYMMERWRRKLRFK